MKRLKFSSDVLNSLSGYVIINNVGDSEFRMSVFQLSEMSSLLVLKVSE